jgi:ferrous iron transport protein A
VAVIIRIDKQLNGSVHARSGLVSHFTDEEIGGKLMAMGILPGSRIELVRRAPFGGGWYVKVDNNFIALRKQEAACIIMS